MSKDTACAWQHTPRVTGHAIAAGYVHVRTPRTVALERGNWLVVWVVGAWVAHWWERIYFELLPWVSNLPRWVGHCLRVDAQHVEEIAAGNRQVK